MARIVALSNESAAVVAVYAEQPEAGVAFALAFPEGELPRLVYWGRPMTHPETVVDAADALRPQRVSGALDYTPWPSVLPTQAEAWIGEPRLALRRDGRGGVLPVHRDRHHIDRRRSPRRHCDRRGRRTAGGLDLDDGARPLRSAPPACRHPQPGLRRTGNRQGRTRLRRPRLGHRDPDHHRPPPARALPRSASR